MNLDESQRKIVAKWIVDGLKLSEIQSRLASELGARLTYMDVRLLVDDLKLVPKDNETPKTAQVNFASSSSSAPANARTANLGATTPDASPPASQTGSKVSVVVDQLTRPGALVSGKVTFSDGHRADWYLDQTGRLGLVAQQPGYRPPPADLQQFQKVLESELSKIGF